MAGIDYSAHRCGKCSQPAYGSIKTKLWAAYLCYTHYWAEVNRYLLLHPLTKPSEKLINQTSNV